MPTLKIVTFGHTRVTLDGQDIVWHATSARDLFFYLLSFPDGRSQRDASLALWPDEENENAASSNRFRVALHRVRAALGKTESVFKDYERYRLSPEVLATSDVFAMQVALREAQLTGPALHAGTQAARQALQRAADLYGGEYLTEVRTDWADTVREEYKASYVRATLELSMLHCEAAECDLAIRHLAQALRADPLIGENYHQDLMACLASVESKYAAVEHYRRFIKYLRSDLADTPMLETTALAERLKGNDFTCPHQIGSHAPCARHLAQRAVGATLLSFEPDGTFEPDGSEVHGSLERVQLGLKLADALQSAGTLSEVAHLTLEALGAALKLESLFIFLVDSGVLRVSKVWGEIPPELHPLLELGSLPLDAVALCRQVVQTGEAQYAENISLLLTAAPETKPTAAGAVPVAGQAGTLEAVLAVSRPLRVGAWTVHEQALLTQAARTLGFTLRQDALYIGVPNSSRRESLPVTQP